MNAPIIWIIFPAVAAVVMFFFRRHRKTINLLGFFVAIFLAFLAWLLHIGETYTIGIIPNIPTITIQDTLVILGRGFVIEESTRATLLLIFSSVAFWFGAATIARSVNTFVPVGLGMAALLTAAISVVPFLYAAILIVLTALVSVVILVPMDTKPSRGVLRFLTFQTLGMPFILIAGWYLSGIETEIIDQQLVLRILATLGIGLALFMAIFPFHSWIPLLAQEAHPYTVAFLVYMIPQAVSLFVLNFIIRFSWISVAPIAFNAIRLMGVLMVGFGGIWAAFQKHLGRMLGFAALMEIGYTLLALSILEPGSFTEITSTGTEIVISNPLIGIYYGQFLPRLVGLGLWALALVIIKSNVGDLDFQSIRSAAYKMPFASISVIVAIFSLAGLPLFAGFPIRLALWSVIMEKSQTIALLMLVGISGLLIAGLRVLSILIHNTDRPMEITESRSQVAFLLIGCAILLIFGLFPHLFLSAVGGITGIIGISSP